VASPHCRCVAVLAAMEREATDLTALAGEATSDASMPLAEIGENLTSARRQ
jgi:hypothetical protein